MTTSSERWRCAECGHVGRGPQHPTLLGGTVCGRCHEVEQTRTAGLLGGLGVGSAVASRALGRWVRRALRRPGR